MACGCTRSRAWHAYGVHAGKEWEMMAQLNAKWLRKPLLDGLVAPALKAYFAADKVCPCPLPLLYMWV